MLDEIVNKSRPDRVRGLTQADAAARVPQVGKGRCVHPPLRHCWCWCTRDGRLDQLSPRPTAKSLCPFASNRCSGAAVRHNYAKFRIREEPPKPIARHCNFSEPEPEPDPNFFFF